MSIYATYHIFKINPEWSKDDFIQIFAQGVPGHIGHPSAGYETDPYSNFLPPAHAADDPDYLDKLRAMVFVTAETEINGQEYVNPLLVMSGEEYRTATFDSIMFRLQDILQERRN